MGSGEKKTWLIQAYDGLNLLFSFEVSVALSEGEIGSLLQRLASRDLTPHEVLHASTRKRMKGYNGLLEVRKEQRDRIILSVGENPHYIASLHNDTELADIKAH
ncbi:MULTISPECIES: hypothetical protein [Sinorhizobium]|uniref:hypothetical protein n=1 Tax=Sinorhizobium TaxID=28105 RepID=UPI0004629E8E|nr:MULTISPECIES: hypothetical protein [Sinorhizobium]MDX0467454.1 hypothetical protein [Sinorhizobium medicae]MDX0631868.1 hypothetical protein [Sinorhizobium medicae]MDX0955642.1 hypothetical protein [Sinorhizobium medicae]MDX1174299.1 hypothetical protein [Sinorhizobium medicae]MDX1245247.1 hypothetical protein [Sinorhizobium medicae]